MTPRRFHPSVFLILIVPFGAIGGYLQVTLAFLLTEAGVPVAVTAGLIALAVLPHTWKFLWAPIADTTLSRKRWYVIASVLTAVSILLMGLIPPTAGGLRMLGAVVLISNIAVTFLAMSVESLMAYATPEDEKGRAAGWFQAGYLGGSGVGGGLGLLLAQSLAAPWMAGAVLAAACLLCMLPLIGIREPESPPREGGLVRSLEDVVRDLWQVARSRLGALALILCLLPIGSGAASGLWAAVAKDWSASASTVALVTGFLGGVVSAVGCLAGGWFSDRMNRKAAYVIYGVLQALCAIAMAIAPHTETSYVIFTTLYAFITGLTYAGFSAFVLEAMGLGAAATKYNLYASASNLPIYYMTQIDGWAHTRWGPSALLYAEAVMCSIGLVALGLVLTLWPARRGATATAVTTPATE